ncbi:MAG: Prolyl-tRNA synthetase [Microgenomates group bacterium GW2011_GWC2_46_7]|nr:MAG: Prolyl-tRNA synthetase [Microgenomates group bacterium GW2011_GWC2_46_7]
MKYSQMFAKSLKSAPANAETINHKLLVQAGFVRQVMAGVYTYLPLGLRVLNKISQIVREEMDGIGGQEVLMPLLHPSALWKQTGGWDKIDVLFKIKSRTDKEYALAQSNEETVTPLAKEWIHSAKDLPLAIYHINAKFRDELRSKSGILRGREFLMKDMYSWHATQADFDEFYTKVKAAYMRVFARLGLTAKATEASGGAFSEKVSYEFEVLTDAGEAPILYCDQCDYCVNVDDIKTYKEGEDCPICGKDKLKSAMASEVGNVFDLGTKYTKAFELTINDEKGKKIYPIMGCYGIGISRTMGVLVEKFHDERGIMWPVTVSPFQLHLVSLNTNDEAVVARTEALYKKLTERGIEVLYDDRAEAGAGQKLADADLLGIPYRAIVSAKTGDKVELKKRNEKEGKLVSVEELISELG